MKVLNPVAIPGLKRAGSCTDKCTCTADALLEGNICVSCTNYKDWQACSTTPTLWLTGCTVELGQWARFDPDISCTAAPNCNRAMRRSRCGRRFHWLDGELLRGELPTHIFYSHLGAISWISKYDHTFPVHATAAQPLRGEGPARSLSHCHVSVCRRQCLA